VLCALPRLCGPKMAPECTLPRTPLRMSSASVLCALQRVQAQRDGAAVRVEPLHGRHMRHRGPQSAQARLAQCLRKQPEKPGQPQASVR